MNEEWFKGSVDYWSEQEASVNGVLGGYGVLHTPDIRDSKLFLQKINFKAPLNGHGLDVGAGIGRISKHLLAPLLCKVSVLESNEKYVEKAREVLGDQLDNVYTIRLQEYTLLNINGIYDIIWIQWVLMYASDAELVEFLKACKRSLRQPGVGVIIVKENTVRGEEGCWVDAEIDESDRSIVRCDAHFKKIFMEAGLELKAEAIQRGFPSDLFPVKMYALQ